MKLFVTFVAEKTQISRAIIIPVSVLMMYDTCSDVHWLPASIALPMSSCDEFPALLL